MRQVWIVAAMVLALTVGLGLAALVAGEESPLKAPPTAPAAPPTAPAAPSAAPVAPSAPATPSAPAESATPPAALAPVAKVKMPPAEAAAKAPAEAAAKVPAEAAAKAPAEAAAKAPAEAAVKAPAAVPAKGTSPMPAGPGTITPPAPLPDVEIPPIPPVGDDPFKPGPMPVRKKRPDVLEEGKHLFNREGRIEVDPIGRSIFVFDSGDKAMRVLENSWRQYLERSTESGKKKIRWRVSGTVMVYEEENYLLIPRAVHVLAEEEGF